MATENELKTMSRKKQSPIDLLDKITHITNLPPLIMSGHWLNDGKAYLRNDGKNAIVSVKGERIPSIISAGPLHDEYELLEVKFYWGKDDCNGSEHTINGTWYSMEAQAVHWNRKYLRFNECLKYEDGLCILSFLFLVQEENDPIYVKLEKITENLKDIIEEHSMTEIPANSLCWMRRANSSDYYYYYKGSYNVDDNPECALWIVFPNFIPIRADQVMAFRRLRDAENEEIESNTRRIQHLGIHRKIYKAMKKC